MNDEAISFDASDGCPNCGSTNWVVDQGDGHLLQADRPTRRNDRACNVCGVVWQQTIGA